MRLEISFYPFKFQSQDHALLSALFIFFITGIPALDIALRLLIQGNLMDCAAFVIVRGLYEGQEFIPFPGITCFKVGMQISHLIFYDTAFLHFYITYYVPSFTQIKLLLS
jgi:hypothetical protein